MDRALVTGANGFVGAALCRKLVEQGIRVRGLVRRTSDLSALADLPVELIVGALDQPATLREACTGVDTVFHVAATASDWGTLESFRRVNVEGTRGMLDAAVSGGAGRFLHVSSVAVHSFTGAQDMDENSPQLPTTFPYCQSKREAEAVVRSYQAQGNIATTIVRPGDVYGPGDRVSLLKLAPLLERGWLLQVDGGRRLGAFAYVENLADGIILAATADCAIGETYVLTDGLRLTWNDYLRRLCAALDRPPPRGSVPSRPAYVVAAMLETAYGAMGIASRPPITRYLVTHLSKDFHFSVAKAERELGYAPRIDLETAISRTAQWYVATVRGKAAGPPT